MLLLRLYVALVRLVAAVFAELRTGSTARMPARISRRVRGADAERGDVPGWVLVTVMTAGLVTTIWLVAGPRLTEMLTGALDGVTGP